MVRSNPGNQRYQIVFFKQDSLVKSELKWLHLVCAAETSSKERG